jgi:hypothetical protein
MKMKKLAILLMIALFSIAAAIAGADEIGRAHV